MKNQIYLITLLAFLITSCNPKNMKQSELKNEAIKNYAFLKEMYEDSYFPKPLVDKGKEILIELCKNIEDTSPKDLEELYKLSHSATDKFNDLAEEFDEQESEIETAARECIAVDFEFISKSYGFEADVEELIATRDW